MTSNISKFKTAVGDGIGNHIDALVPTVGYENKLDTYIPDVDRGELYIIEKGSYISENGEPNQSHENDCYYILAVSSKEMACQYKFDAEAMSFRQHIDGIWADWKEIGTMGGIRFEIGYENLFDEYALAHYDDVIYVIRSGSKYDKKTNTVVNEGNLPYYVTFWNEPSSVYVRYYKVSTNGVASNYGFIYDDTINWNEDEDNETIRTISSIVKTLGQMMVFSIDKNSTSDTIPTAKAVYEAINSVKNIGQKTTYGGLIFNDYRNNEALSEYATSMGSNTISGGRGYEVLLQEAISSSGSSKTYDFPYFQHEGAGFGTCFVSGDLREMGLEVGMKCTLTVGGVTATGVVIDAINYDSISITFSAVPWDFPNHSGGTLTIGEEAPPKIVYTLDSVNGIEIGMAYSLVNPSGESKYNAGTIKEIAEDKVTVDDDGSINAKGCFMAIIGHPELGTQDIGINSFAVGNGTVALSENQVARGKFNVEDNTNQYADIVGNGKSDADRSNAYTLDWDGNAEFAGNVKAGKATIDSDDDLILVTKSYLKSYVDAAIKAAIGSALEGDY